MGFTFENLDGLTRIAAHLERCADADFTPLMEAWATILEEDNERGLMAGEDCDGNAMPPTQRERGVGTSRRGSGRPLVPHGMASRAIDLPKHGTGHTTAAPWLAFISWPNFDSKDGRPILWMHAHPDGQAPYPKRDIISRPRPEAIKRARETLRAFVKNVLKYKR